MQTRDAEVKRILEIKKATTSTLELSTNMNSSYSDEFRREFMEYADKHRLDGKEMGKRFGVSVCRLDAWRKREKVRVHFNKNRLFFAF